jgi:hypothetical protein
MEVVRGCCSSSNKDHMSVQVFFFPLYRLESWLVMLRMGFIERERREVLF